MRLPAAGSCVLAVAVLLGGCGGGSGLSGTAVALQDVEGLGAPPLSQGWIVAVPAASADAVWSRGALPPDHELPYASTPLSRTQVEDVGGPVGAIDDGDFSLAPTPGEHLVCLVEDDGAGEWARGCGWADLPASGRLDVSIGEAGFRVAVRS